MYCQSSKVQQSNSEPLGSIDFLGKSSLVLKSKELQLKEEVGGGGESHRFHHWTFVLLSAYEHHAEVQITL